MQFIYLAKSEITMFRVNFVFVKIFVTSHKIQSCSKQPHSGNVKQVDPPCCFKSWLKLTITFSCTYNVIVRGEVFPSPFPCLYWWKIPALLQSTIASDTSKQWPCSELDSSDLKKSVQQTAKQIGGPQLGGPKLALAMADPRCWPHPAAQQQGCSQQQPLGTALGAPMPWKRNMIINHASATTRLLLTSLAKMKVVFSMSKPLILKMRNWPKQKSTGPPSLINRFPSLRRDSIFLSSQGICKSKRCYCSSLGPNGWEWSIVRWMIPETDRSRGEGEGIT